jgi:hypothetical protein
VSGLADHKILGLTVRRPWAELIAQGIKTIENRSWAPPAFMLGRYLAIHASPMWDQEGEDFIRRNHPRFAVDPPPASECPHGIIAVAQLVGWVQRGPENDPGRAPWRCSKGTPSARLRTRSDTRSTGGGSSALNTGGSSAT